MPKADRPMSDLLHHYLCSYCDRFFAALPNSVDRTRFVRCPDCASGDAHDLNDLAAAALQRVGQVDMSAFLSDPPNTVIP